MNTFKKWSFICSAIVFLIAGILYYMHYDFYSVPAIRPALSESFSDMAEDRFHHYVDLQVDYTDLSRGQYRGYYLLSPDFFNHKNITFILTDGQMELVNPGMDFEFFEDVLGGSAYVLIGVRGQAPLYFQEVYKNGKIDYEQAIRLYSSDQQVEDIEQVRHDLIKKGYLKDEKINIFGASGAGVLAQQYLSKYGKHVNRAILESTGAPDISRKLHKKYSPDFKDFNPQAAEVLENVFLKDKTKKPFICNVLYQQGRTEKSPREAQQKTVESLQKGGGLFKYMFVPVTNLSLLKYLIQSPQELAPRIRWFELAGYDLMNYDTKTETNLLYEFSMEAVSDILNYYKENMLAAKEFQIDRSFTGEVLIIKGNEDVVFGDAINQEMQKAYPNAKILFFKDGHRMQNNRELYKKIRTDFLQYGFLAESVLQAERHSVGGN